MGGSSHRRWFIRLDEAAITVVRSGQVKLLLNRGSANPPSWFMLGFGPQSPQNLTDELNDVSDYNSGLLPAGKTTGFVIVAEAWIELRMLPQRTGTSIRRTDGDCRSGCNFQVTARPASCFPLAAGSEVEWAG